MFEGYVGIHLRNGQSFEDVIFSILLFLMFLFAISVHFNIKSFINIFYIALFNRTRRNSDITIYNNIFLTVVLTFQTLALLSLFIVHYAYDSNCISYNFKESTLTITLLLSYIYILFYYLCRRFIYKTIIFIFAPPDYYKQWAPNYNSIMAIMGILMYIPVVWQLAIRGTTIACVFIFISIYILSRFAIIYKSIRLFSTKKIDFFHLSLYLCANEIAPLWIMYKGIIYLYNFIEKSAIWH